MPGIVGMQSRLATTESTQRDPIDSRRLRIVSRQFSKIMIDRPVLSTARY